MKANPKTRRQLVERAALKAACDFPEWGQARVAAALTAEGLTVSAAGVRCIWQRHGLETMAKRAAALRARAREGLTRAQQAALKRMAMKRGGEPRGEAGPLGRDGILAVAVREFSRKGFARTSMRDIAHAAGIQPGSLYYHFESKDELFVAAHSAGMREVVRAMEAALAALAARRDPWHALEVACTVHIEHLVSGNDLTVWTGAALFLFGSPSMQAALRAERDRFEAVYRRLIEALPLPGGIDRRLMRLQLLGALNWTRTWYRPGRRTPAEIARHLVKLLREPLAT